MTAGINPSNFEKSITFRLKQKTPPGGGVACRVVRSSGPKSRTTPPARMGRMVMHVMVAHEHDVSAYFDPSAAVKRAPVTPVLSSFTLSGRRRPGAPAQ